MSLFRDEVLSKKIEHLHGSINLAIPVSWHLIGGSLASILGITSLFLFSASYARTEIALGSVLPAGGILQVIPPRPGWVDEVAVREGQLVRKGELLARIRAEGTDTSGVGTQTAVLSAIEQQRRGLEVQEASARSASESEQREYEVQISGLQEEVRSIDLQIADQRRLVGMASADLTQASKIASRGFISQRDLSVREETLLSRRQQLAALQQAKSSKLSSVQQFLRARSQAAAKASGAVASLGASQAQNERERATAKGDQGYSLFAPTDGRVAALDFNVGDTVTARDSAMMIVPSGGKLIAKLFIPGKAAGFVRAGQTIRLAMDAYPFERFGTVRGSISIVSSAPVMRTEKEGSASPFYVATAAIERPFVRAYGKSQPLVPGMTFAARIVVERRSLLQWLFDPLVAAVR